MSLAEMKSRTYSYCEQMPSDDDDFTILHTAFNDLGYTDVIKGLIRMGLLSPDQHPALHSQVRKSFKLNQDEH